jgi:hypothetical protein
MPQNACLRHGQLRSIVGPTRIFEMAQPVVFDPELMLLVLGGVLLVAIGTYVALEVRGRFRDREESIPAAATLEQYRELRDQGLLDEAEFERVRLLFERRSQVGKIPEDIRPLDDRFRVVDGRIQPPGSPPDLPKPPEPPA